MLLKSALGRSRDTARVRALRAARRQRGLEAIAEYVKDIKDATWTLARTEANNAAREDLIRYEKAQIREQEQRIFLGALVSLVVSGAASFGVAWWSMQ